MNTVRVFRVPEQDYRDLRDALLLYGPNRGPRGIAALAIARCRGERIGNQGIDGAPGQGGEKGDQLILLAAVESERTQQR